MASETTPRILVTGSRDWTDREAIEEALKGAYIELGVGILVSGACPTGADAIAEEIWGSHGFPVERHPADWEKHGKAAGPLRNQQMVDLGADVCLAFPLANSRGTRHCMGAAERAGIPVITPCDDGCDPANIVTDTIDSDLCTRCGRRGPVDEASS